MYKTLSADDFRRHVRVPDNYTVDGVVCLGSVRRKQHRIFLGEILADLGLNPQYETLQENSFLEGVTALNIEGKRIWFESVHGGSYLAMLLHCACLFGSRKNILIGTYGGLLPGGKMGDVLVPSASYGDESSTRTYHPDNSSHLYPAHPQLSDSLRRRLDPKYRQSDGTVMTCQAIFAETQADVLRWSQAGYAGVEMESATFFAVSNYFNRPSAALLINVDNLIDGENLFDDRAHEREQIRIELRKHLFQTAFREILA